MNKSFGLFDTDEEIVGMQRFLNEKLSMHLKADGNIGKITQSALQTWQASQGITETDARGPCYGPQSQAIIKQFCQLKYLEPEDFTSSASAIDIEEAALRAVTTVEAKEFGFLDNGLPVILFERHIFYKQLVKAKGVAVAAAISAANPDICNPATGGYQGGAAEYLRYNRAVAINETCACLSTSFGLFQIMGFNFKQAGYDSVEAYVADMRISEDLQLKAFCSYVKNDSNNSLHKSLKTHNWAAFAGEYNGPGYAANHYDTKMQAGYDLGLKLSAK